MRRLLSLLIIALSALAPLSALAQEKLTIFAAASMAEAVEALSDAYQRTSGANIRLSIAASSTLARQIEAGAPANIYISANREWVDYLATRDLIAANATAVICRNALVLVVPNAEKAAPSNQVADILKTATHIAIADPAHVPAGIYAKAAIKSLGLEDAAHGKLVIADNVRAALALVARGEADAGFVYATDARLSEDVSIAALISQAAHPPLEYVLGVVEPATSTARAFADFVTSSVGVDILKSFGFQAGD